MRLERAARLVVAASLGIDLAACGPGSLAPPQERALNWSPAETIDGVTATNAPAVDGLHMAGNDGGIALAVWAQSQPGGSAIWTNRHVSGAGWDGPRVLDDGVSPIVGVDDAGNALAAWTRIQAQRSRGLWWSRLSAGSGWSAPEQSTAEALSGQALAVAGNGRALLVWTTGKAVWAEDFDPRAGWAGPEEIGVDVPRFGVASSVAAPQLVLDSKGDATVVWSQGYTPGVHDFSSVLRGAHRVAGSAWEPPQDLSAFGGGLLQGDDNGNALLVWYRADGSVHFARLSPADGWHAPQDLAAPPGFRPGALAMNAAGTAVLLLSDLQVQLASLTYTPDAGWGAASLISSGVIGPSNRDVAVAMSGPGEALAVWTRFVRGQASEVWSARASPWGIAGPVFADAGTRAGPCPDVVTPGAREVRLTVDRAGAALVAWIDYDCVTTRIRASQLLSLR